MSLHPEIPSFWWLDTPGSAQARPTVTATLVVDTATLGQAGVGDDDGEVLAGLYLLITLPTATPMVPAPVSRAWTGVMMGASSFSVAASSSPRVRARSAARIGLRQAISRSPG
jgi:hypothetical protein